MLATRQRDCLLVPGASTILRSSRNDACILLEMKKQIWGSGLFSTPVSPSMFCVYWKGDWEVLEGPP